MIEQEILDFELEHLRLFCDLLNTKYNTKLSIQVSSKTEYNLLNNDKSVKRGLFPIINSLLHGIQFTLAISAYEQH